MSGVRGDDRQRFGAGEELDQLFLLGQWIEPIRGDASHRDRYRHTTERLGDATTTSTDVVVIHRFAQDDVAVRIEPRRQFVAVVAKVRLNGVATGSQHVAVALGRTTESALELATGAVAELAESASDRQAFEGDPTRGVVIATAEVRVDAVRSDLQ